MIEKKNYIDTVSYLYANLPVFQNVGSRAYKEGLDTIVELCRVLGNPHTKITNIHVAGTNGKGSVSHITASILQESGYKVGLYTSPHLLDFRERIQINGEYISEDFIVDFVHAATDTITSIKPSFFEITVAMAFSYFYEKKVDFAVIEVGMGGRLDSTNIITPVVSCITNIGLDHMMFLGDTKEKIAREKAGIIKKNIPVVIGESNSETDAVFKEIAVNRNAPIVFADKECEVISQYSDAWYSNFTISDGYRQIEHCSSELLGVYQKKNICTAYAVVTQLQKIGIVIHEEHIKQGLARVIQNTHLKGRWQIVQKYPLVMCDTAHNEHGIAVVMTEIAKLPYNTLHVVWGMVSDKNVLEILPLLPKHAHFYICEPSIERAFDSKTLYTIFIENNFKANCYTTVSEAYKNAALRAKDTDLIYVGGSTFVVADFLSEKK